MNKKVKKKMDALKSRIQKLQQQIAGAKRQADDPEELARLESEITEAQRELDELKSS